MSGNVMASPAMAIAPTPRPMKMLSMMLYSDVATLAIIAGTEYCANKRGMERSPNSIGDVFGCGCDMRQLK